jgi:hypothetical protein
MNKENFWFYLLVGVAISGIFSSCLSEVVRGRAINSLDCTTVCGERGVRLFNRNDCICESPCP